MATTTTTATDSGSARVFSGKDGKILYTFYGDSAYDYFGGLREPAPAT